jgi:predicted AlkP superfamily phosphohydrolase/phosphomutase
MLWAGEPPRRSFIFSMSLHRKRARPRARTSKLCGVLLLLWFATSGCGAEANSGRVVLIGIDGAAPRVIDDLLAKGRLPNLHQLAQEGGRGLLRSAKPISSPRIWNTIATGKVPSKHGILHFSRIGDDEKHHLFLSTDRKVRTLWSIASRRGRSVGIVNFWNTFPPEIVDGVMVSDHLLATEIAGRELIVGAQETAPGAVIYPQGWHDRLKPLVADKSPLTRITNPFAAEKVLPSTAKREDLNRHFYEDAALTRIAERIEADLRPDLMMVLLPGIDRISHFLWGVLEPEQKYPPPLRPSVRERKGGRTALEGYYEYTDALIGRLIAGFGPNDLVLVVSDHGFEAGETFMVLTGTHESELALDGIIFARGPGISPGSEIEGVSIEDITPTLLNWMGIPTGADMDGNLASFVDVPHLSAIPSHDEGEIEVLRSAPSGVENEIVDQLRTLGYLEDD